jgi:hypothetical protein
MIIDLDDCLMLNCFHQYLIILHINIKKYRNLFTIIDRNIHHFMYFRFIISIVHFHSYCRYFIKGYDLNFGRTFFFECLTIQFYPLI